jgi:hypothetical protein
MIRSSQEGRPQQHGTTHLPGLQAEIVEQGAVLLLDDGGEECVDRARKPFGLRSLAHAQAGLSDQDPLARWPPHAGRRRGAPSDLAVQAVPASPKLADTAARDVVVVVVVIASTSSQSRRGRRTAVCMEEQTRKEEQNEFERKSTPALCTGAAAKGASRRAKKGSSVG